MPSGESPKAADPPGIEVASTTTAVEKSSKEETDESADELSHGDVEAERSTGDDESHDGTDDDDHGEGEDAEGQDEGEGEGDGDGDGDGEVEGEGDGSSHPPRGILVKPGTKRKKSATSVNVLVKGDAPEREKKKGKYIDKKEEGRFGLVRKKSGPNLLRQKTPPGTPFNLPCPTYHPRISHRLSTPFSYFVRSFVSFLF